MTQYIRLVFDVAFVAIAILSFYMWALLNEKYRKVKERKEFVEGCLKTSTSDNDFFQKDCWRLQEENDRLLKDNKRLTKDNGFLLDRGCCCKHDHPDCKSQVAISEKDQILK